ncbi:MAG: DNA mismatch repair endonuclease MutL, partial [Alphaproteobacteria bacterium]
MRINRLSQEMVNRIAAGEVIERPASVVKELMENAIDAGAGAVEVVVADGGVSLIRVSDDGSGIASAELPLAVERHCTSKLGAGLHQISSLGFRGEALASIGAAAKLAITSRAAGADTAASIEIAGGELSGPRPAALARGTRVEVRDLFFSTPARLKFLKSSRAESTAIIDALKRLALANPAVRFSLHGAGRSALDYPAETGEDGLKARIRQVLGADFITDAIAIDAKREEVSLAGFTSVPTHSRANGLAQFLFVNGRPVRDRQLLGALRAAYADVMKPGRFPVAALFITLDSAHVDVNVHPAKADVRFRDPGLIRGLIVGAVREALAGTRPRAATLKTDSTIAAFRRPGSRFGPAPGLPTGGSTPPKPGATGFAEAAAAAFAFAAPTAAAAGEEPVPDAENNPMGAARAQLHETYIVAQTADGLLIVDQ